MQSLPLRGIRIVSFEQFGAAPYATMFLADLGAEVFKVESTGGDTNRHAGPLTLGENDSLFFQCFNLNKKSIFINLKDAADRIFFEDVVRTSQAVMNNLRGSAPARLGLDYAALKPINPAIVCGHISAYGRNNSRADRPGYDFLMQAEAGIMALTGEPGNPPTRIGVSMIDYMTGMMLAVGVMSAVHAAAKTGIGTDVDVSLFDAAVHQLAYQGTWYLNEKIVTTRTPRSAHPSNTPVQLFKTADGWLYVACMAEKFWQLLCRMVERPDLLNHPNFESSNKRLAHRDELTTTLDGIFSKRTTAEWVESLSAKIPVAPVYDLEGALNNPFLDEVDMINEVPHPSRATIKVFANPLRINGERLVQKAAPKLGEHTDALKAEIGQRFIAAT